MNLVLIKIYDSYYEESVYKCCNGCCVFVSALCHGKTFFFMGFIHTDAFGLQSYHVI